jgi:hypothetical protein
MSRIPVRKAETFTFNGIPNQRVSDIWHQTEGAYSLNWLRKALRDGCANADDLKAYRSRVTDERIRLMHQRRDEYWARVRAERAKGQ